MIKNLMLSIALIIGLSSCTKSVNEPIVENSTEEGSYNNIFKLFPLNVDDKHVFSVDTLNKQSFTFEDIGTREMSVDGAIEESDYKEIYCSNVFLLSNQNSIKQSVFNLNNEYLEVIIDKVGITNMLSDSLDFKADVIFDGRIKILYYPLEVGQEWDVTSLEVNMGFAKMKLISVTAEYEGKEDISLPNNEGKITCEKIGYKGQLNIPNINNPFMNQLKEFDATLWFAEDIGIVKMEGFAIFINTIFGSGFNVSDTNRVERHTLLSYK